MAEERALQSQVFFGIDPEKTFSFFSGYIVAKKKEKKKTSGYWSNYAGGANVRPH